MMDEKKINIYTQGGPVINGGTFTNVEFVANKYVVEKVVKASPMDKGVEDAEVVEEPHRQSKEAARFPKEKGEPSSMKSAFYDIVQHEDPDKLVERLHQLIDGRRGADVGCVLLKCLLDGYITRKPKQREFESEFTLIGGWTAIHNYMNDNNENALDRANKIIIF